MTASLSFPVPTGFRPGIFANFRIGQLLSDIRHMSRAQYWSRELMIAFHTSTAILTCDGVVITRSLSRKIVFHTLPEKPGQNSGLPNSCVKAMYDAHHAIAGGESVPLWSAQNVARYKA